MQRTFALASAALVAWMALPTDPADAMVKRKSRNGLEEFSDQVWNNQPPLVNGDPWVEFPLGCRRARCKYTIWLDFIEGIGKEAAQECRDDPKTAWYDCEINDHCVLWVEFGDSIMPLTNWHGWNYNTRRPADNAIITVSWNSPDARINRNTGFLWNGHEAFHGRNFELLHIIATEVDVFDEGLCRAGLAAQYHPNSKTVFENGYLLPR